MRLGVTKEALPRREGRGVALWLPLGLAGGGFQSGGSRGRGRGGKRGNQSGKNVLVEPHRHEGE